MSDARLHTAHDERRLTRPPFCVATGALGKLANEASFSSIHVHKFADPCFLTDARTVVSTCRRHCSTTSPTRTPASSTLAGRLEAAAVEETTAPPPRRARPVKLPPQPRPRLQQQQLVSLSSRRQRKWSLADRFPRRRQTLPLRPPRRGSRRPALPRGHPPRAPPPLPRGLRPHPAPPQRGLRPPERPQLKPPSPGPLLRVPPPPPRPPLRLRRRAS